jgi:hypothetical protein
MLTIYELSLSMTETVYITATPNGHRNYQIRRRVRQCAERNANANRERKPPAVSRAFLLIELVAADANVQSVDLLSRHGRLNLNREARACDTGARIP